MTAAVEERPVEAKPDRAKDKPEDTPVVVPEVEEYATFEDLLNKPAREKDVVVTAGKRSLKLHLRAIGSTAYDQLMSSCPPDEKDRERMQPFHLDEFAPKLLAACVTRPKMDLDRASRLWKDPNWSGGEVGGLYRQCVELCQAGLDVPFTGGA